MDYQEFRKRYEEMHPASVPVPDVELSHYPDWLRYVVALMYACAAIVSGAHTIPLVQGTLELPSRVPVIGVPLANVVALAAFGFIELVLLAVPFALMYFSSWLTVGILAISATAAMTANIYSVVQKMKAENPGELFVALVIGIAAPGVCTLSGKLYVAMHGSRRSIQTRASATYRQACKDFDALVLRAWKQEQKEHKPSVRPTVRLSERTPSDRTEVSPGDKVRAYLDSHPEAKGLSVRDLSGMLSVGRDTVHRVKREYESNGYGVKGNGDRGSD
jgi:hypothetical protein